MDKIRLAIFDLDGVLVDTAKYHYLAWLELADELGINFTPEDNERLKGVSRQRSLEILLAHGNRTEKFSQDEKNAFVSRKNNRYIAYISKIGPSELLPGVLACFNEIRSMNIKIALGSASRNSALVLQRLQIMDWFDAVVDGNHVSRSKPDPEVFVLAARQLGIPEHDCAVFEDSMAGIEAAKACGMTAIGIGDPCILKAADAVIPGLHAFSRDLLA